MRSTSFTLATTLILILPLLVAGLSIPRPQCTHGPILCCEQVKSSSDPSTYYTVGTLGFSLPVTLTPGLVGLRCDTLPILGFNSAPCAGETVCCSRNSFGGIVVLGCSHIDAW